MSRFPQRIWLAAFIVAWAVDFLFWGKSAGISFLIFVVITLAAGFVLAGFEKAAPGWAQPAAQCGGDLPGWRYAGSGGAIFTFSEWVSGAGRVGLARAYLPNRRLGSLPHFQLPGNVDRPACGNAGKGCWLAAGS